MADKTITLKNQRLNVLGPTPTQQWGANNDWNTMTWGTSTWGLKSAGVGGAPCLIYNVGKQLGVQTLVVTSPRSYRNANKNWSASILPVFYLNNRQLTDGSGYYYIYNDRVTNVESATVYTYTSLITGTSGWTLVGTSGSVTWS